MDEAHLFACARYVELNPVRAGLVERPEQWRWSSVHAHLSGRGTGLVDVRPLLDRAPDWAAFLGQGLAETDHKAIRAAERTGRPLGAKAFVEQLERATGRTLTRGKPGPKPKA
jgi:putative transposase